jgi:hypothetical protein
MFPAMNCRKNSDCNDNNNCTIDTCNEQNGSCVWRKSIKDCAPKCKNTGDIQFTLELLTDNFGNETTWSIRNMCSNKVIHSGGHFVNNKPSLHTIHICLPMGQYNLTVFDSKGTFILSIFRFCISCLKAQN